MPELLIPGYNSSFPNAGLSTTFELVGIEEWSWRLDIPRIVGAMLGLKRAAPTANLYRETENGPTARPAWRT